MKKYLPSIPAILFLLPSLIWAEADGPDYWDVTNVTADDVLNVRQSPSATSHKTGSLLAHQTCVKNLGCVGVLSLSEYMALSEDEKQQQKNKFHWCKINYQDLTGWVLNKYIKESSHSCYQNNSQTSIQPTFDCKKANGSVEELICQDNELAQLDQKLSALYKILISQVAPDEVKLIRAFQRGWIKGRNDCWKSMTSKKACVKKNYLIRISELQVQSGSVMGKQVLYDCESTARINNDQANNVTVFYYPTDIPSIILTYGILPSEQAYISPSASGSKYLGGDILFWTKGKEALFKWKQLEEVHCQEHEVQSNL